MKVANQSRCFLLFLSLFWVTITQAQVKMSLRVAPGISISHVNNSSKVPYQEAGPNRLAGSLSINTDVFLSPKVAFSTGLWYTIKASSVSVPGVYAVNVGNGNQEMKNPHAYQLHYLQLPLTLKLYTNEVLPDLKIYFQMGVTLDYKLGEKAVQADHNFFYQSLRANQGSNGGKIPDLYKNWNIGAYAGIGIQWKFLATQTMFTGLTYNQGLLNQFDTHRVPPYLFGNPSIRLSLLALEFGVNF